MEQHGIQLPLEAQGTTNEETRFEKGLEKQVALFGEGMAKRQTEGPELRRTINRWLSANCFGDYYTRSGLNDQEREMITFCFLMAQEDVKTSFAAIRPETSASATEKRKCTALWSSACRMWVIPEVSMQ